MNPKALEASKEKEIAEKMMITNDYLNARDKLIQAYHIYPQIENIGPMIAVCDVLSASSIKFPGSGVDFYWVLQLTPSSTYSDVTSCYQKLMQMLRPIRYKFPGTDSALKLVQDAFSVLSNQTKRSAFDLKRSQSWENYQKSFSISIKKTVRKNETLSGLDETKCDIGGKQDERVFHKCGQSFSSVSSRITIEEDMDKSADSRKKVLGQEFYDFDKDRKIDYFEVGEIWAAHSRTNLNHNYRYARIEDILEPNVCVTWLKPVPISVGERRWCDAGLPVACGSFELDLEMKDTESWPMVSSHKCTWVHGATDDQFEIYPEKGEIWAIYKDWSLDEWTYNRDNIEGCKFDLVEILDTFSKYSGANCACLVKVDGFRRVFQRQTVGGSSVIAHIPPDNLYVFSHKIPFYKFYGGEIDNVVYGMFELDQLALPYDMKMKNKNNPRKALEEEEEGNPPRTCNLTPKKQENKILNPTWSKNDFSVGQVWAVYSGKDLLPRRYARINHPIYETQIRVTFLDPLPIGDSDPLPMVCGLFQMNETNSIFLDFSQFSHLVKCQQSTSGSMYRIYPLKGEIWAIYKNWNNKWKISDHENYQCEIVEIISDFSEENGIGVAKLSEVKGCLTFFDREKSAGFDLTYVVSRSKMMIFSHRIPCFKVPGIEKYGIAENSWHLEPNALPPPCNKTS